MKVVNYLLRVPDQDSASVLVLLDLSAAFDTIDHHILLERLETLTGEYGEVLPWKDISSSLWMVCPLTNQWYASVFLKVLFKDHYCFQYKIPVSIGTLKSTQVGLALVG